MSGTKKHSFKIGEVKLQKIEIRGTKTIFKVII
jgi:hypothetical protein